MVSYCFDDIELFFVFGALLPDIRISVAGSGIYPGTTDFYPNCFKYLSSLPGRICNYQPITIDLAVLEN